MGTNLYHSPQKKVPSRCDKIVAIRRPLSIVDGNNKTKVFLENQIVGGGFQRAEADMKMTLRSSSTTTIGTVEDNVFIM